MAKGLSHCFYWHKMNEEMYSHVIREFLDNGVNRFVFTFNLAQEILTQKPEKEEFLAKLCKEMGVEFVSMHGLCGVNYDLNIPEPEKRPVMLRDHVRAMELAKRFGSETYTVHVGAYHHCQKHMPIPELRKNALQALEVLVPEAERIGIIIAVENSFEPTNTPDEVLGLIKPFLSSKNIGLCYDTGHANCMTSAPGKVLEKYTPYFSRAWWEKGIIQEAHALEKMRDYVVTCHMHDNSGYDDQHGMPGDGTIDWNKLVPQLKACPRMLEYQTEVEMDGSYTCPAPVGGYSIKFEAETFRKLGF